MRPLGGRPPDVDAAALAAKLGIGSRFEERAGRARIPVNTQNARVVPGFIAIGDTMDTMRPRILVVDDDPSLAEMLTIVLRGEGFDTVVIGDGTQALTAVRELRPDLVLLDLMLPGMNGIDVCRVLRADSGVPIVMLTAKTDTVDVVLGSGVRRRRLRHEAVQAEGARRPGARPAAPQRGRARRDAVHRRRRHRRARPQGHPDWASRSP